MRYRINKEHEKEAQKYIKDVLNKLSFNNEIDDELAGSVTLLGDNYNTFILCEKTLQREGILIFDRFGSKIAHPALKIKNDAIIQIQKLQNDLLLTKKSQLKVVETSTSKKEDVQDDFIQMLRQKKIERR